MLYKIIPSDPIDIKKLNEIAYESKASWGYPVHWLDSWESELIVSPDSFNNEYIFQAIDVRKKILGYYRLLKQEGFLVLNGFWILPKCMGKGIGKALFQHLLETAKKNNFTTIKWESDPNAAAFYKYMGAKETGKKTYLLFGENRVLTTFQIDV